MVFNKLLNEYFQTLNCTLKELSETSGLSVSVLTKYRSGERIPAHNSEQLADLVAGIVKFAEQKHIPNIYYDEVMAKFQGYLNPEADIQFFVEKVQNSFSDFLQTINDFTIEDSKSIFENLEVPASHHIRSKSKTYFSENGRKEAILEFFKNCILSKSQKSITHICDLHFSNLENDKEFLDAYTKAMAIVVKKGHKIKYVYNRQLPVNGLISHIKSFLPFYMTGIFKPYYFEDASNIYYNGLSICDNNILVEEGIVDYPESGKFLLSTAKELQSYYKDRAKFLMDKAHPLIDIFIKDSKKSYDFFIESHGFEDGLRYYISSSLPLFTLDDSILENILKRNSISKDDQIIIKEHIEKQKEQLKEFMKANFLYESLPELTEEQFNEHPVCLDLSGCFYEKKLSYTYEEYLKHLEATAVYAEEHDNYIITTNDNLALNNLQIRINPGKWTLLSKLYPFEAHFVVYEPQLRKAVENLFISQFNKR